MDSFCKKSPQGKPQPAKSVTKWIAILCVVCHTGRIECLANSKVLRRVLLSNKAYLLGT